MGKPPRPERDLPAYFHRLTPRFQQAYLKSDATAKFEPLPDAIAIQYAQELVAVLEKGRIADIERAAGALVAELCRVYAVRPVKVTVKGVRPHNARGELHGLFKVQRPPEIVLWMKTAQRHDVVKPRTFIRTLLHEVCHYFDYVVLELDDSFHTMGFFKRESFLTRALMGTGGKDEHPVKSQPIDPVKQPRML
ncbi:MAG TPA: hypothetical protein VEF03_09060 [Candidatus Binataceae bacterium]|nr:hypothetical protein [Candidatus Binataceae bacterium]